MVLEVCVDYDEALQLKGHMDHVHIFSEKIADVKTNMVQRGKNESTRYLLIPKGMRTNLGYRGISKCQKIETKSKIIFIFMMDKAR